MDELKGTFIVTDSSENFIKAKLIAESYFPSLLNERKEYASRIIHITNNGKVRGEFLFDKYHLLKNNVKEIPFNEFINKY